MEASELLKMMGTSGARRVRKGDVIVLAGSHPQQGLCYILSGAVRIVHRQGEKSLSVGVLGPGQFFGEYSLVLDRPTDFDAIAVEPDTAIMFLRPDKFLRESRSNPLILRELLVTAMNRIGLILQTFTRLNVPVKLEVADDLRATIAANRAANLTIPGLVNNTRSAFVAKGRTVFQQGQTNDGSLYLLTEGCIAANYRLDGIEGIASEFGPGDFFGFSRSASNPNRPYGTVAVTDSRIMTFDQDFLFKLLHLNLDCFWSVFRTAVVQIILLDNAMHASVAAAAAVTSDPAVQREVY